MRRISLLSTILAGLTLCSVTAHAATWCATYGGQGGRNCGFHSWEQCQAAISGNGGFCTQGY